DPEQRTPDAAIAHGDARGGDVDARRVPAEVTQSAPVDVESLHDDPGGADAHHAAVARAAEERAVPPDQDHRLVDEQVALVHAPVDLDAVAGPRAVDAGLQRREVTGSRAALQAAGRRQAVPRGLQEGREE